MLRFCSFVILFCILAGPIEAKTVHVAVDGNDQNPGTMAQPFATLGAALRAVDSDLQGGEIIIHAGRYEANGIRFKHPTLPVANEVGGRLVIRAADGETVIFDGGRSLADAEPLPDVEGVYLAKGNFGRVPPDIWETHTRTRYRYVADVAAVKATPATLCLLDKQTVAFHTSDGLAPRQATKCSLHRFGFFVNRADVLIQGLRFENFLGSRWGTSMDVRGNNVVVENCHSQNAVRGFYAHEQARNTIFRNCTTADVGGGIYTNGINTSVIGCRLLKSRDAFMVPVHAQDDAGVQFYAPAAGGTVRDSFAQGFNNGLFIKCHPGRYVVEHNTFTDGIGFGDQDYSDTHIRWNVIGKYDWPIEHTSGHLGRGARYERNLFYGAADAGDKIRNLQWERGDGNLFGDPFFAHAAMNDYRLLRTSAAVKLGTDRPAGAFAVVPKGFVDPLPPTLTVAMKSPAALAGGRESLYFEPDAWLDREREQIQGYDESDHSVYLTTQRRAAILLDAQARNATVRKVVYQIDAGKEISRAYRPLLTINLPKDNEPHEIAVRVRDSLGRWSSTRKISVMCLKAAPRVVGDVRVDTGQYGAVMMFQTDRPSFVTVEVSRNGLPYESAAPREMVLRRQDLEAGGAWTLVRHQPVADHAVSLRFAYNGAADYKARVTLTDELGLKSDPMNVRFSASHVVQRTISVSTSGVDEAGRGSAQSPYRTLQYAVDRALPGDTILLEPGIYFGSTLMRHGGVAGAPVTITAREPYTAILDGQKMHDSIIQIERAPYVRLKHLIVRWFNAQGIFAYRSPHVEVVGCRLINHYWIDWPTGHGIFIKESPQALVENNVVTRTEHPIMIWSSRHATVRQNTCGMNVFSGLFMIHSALGTRVYNNAFCFTGNESIVIREDSDELPDSFLLDYNNYGTHSRDHGQAGIDSVDNGGYRLEARAKGIFRFNGHRIKTMDAWRERTGLDAHSIFAHPQWVEPESGNWQLLKESPNRGAGRYGGPIGAVQGGS